MTFGVENKDGLATDGEKIKATVTGF